MAPALHAYGRRPLGFVTESDIGGLDGRSGRVETGPAPPTSHGRIEVDSRRPRTLRWEDGTPYFLIAFEADWLALIDQGSGGAERTRTFIDAIAANGFNRVLMNVYAHDAPWPGDLGRGSRFDFSCPSRWPFGGTNDRPDHETLNPRYFETLDRVVAEMRARNVACHLMVYVWNKKVCWPAQDSPADRRSFDYVVARSRQPSAREAAAMELLQAHAGLLDPPGLWRLQTGRRRPADVERLRDARRQRPPAGPQAARELLYSPPPARRRRRGHRVLVSPAHRRVVAARAHRHAAVSPLRPPWTDSFTIASIELHRRDA